MAIYIVWRQSSDFKSQLTQTINGFQRILDRFIEQKRNSFQALADDFKMRSDQELADTASRLAKESNPEIVQELKEHIQKLATMQTDVAPLKHLVIPPDERKNLQKIARTLKGTRSVKEKGNIIRNINAMGNLGRTERIFLNALRMVAMFTAPSARSM